MKVTVFTPTFNRAYIINKLYSSLKEQTNYNFEWLVVDDGSTDNTDELFKKWINENNCFEIRYYKKSNGGKCSAINYALDLAKGDLFFNVDSDDYLTNDAIEKILKWENILSKEKKYCGFAGNLGFSKIETSNTPIEGEYYDGTLLDRYKNIDGERALVFYTEIHKKYKYPLFDGEKFMTEAVVWNRMANDGYLFRFYNDIIWIYEYLEDGLTKKGNQLFVNNPKGYGLWIKEKAIFENKNLFKVYYSYFCDLIPYYKINEIKSFINMPYFYLISCMMIKLFKGGYKK